MPEEVEGLTESSEEAIHHGAHSGPQWASWVALSTTFLAVLAAVAALLSGSNESEAMGHHVEAANQWAYYQAKGIKSKEDQNANTVIVALGGHADPALAENVARYKEEQEKISETAKEIEKERDRELQRHEILSKAVTLFQVAIGISAISILTKKRRYFVVGVVFGAGGLIFLILGLLKYLAH